MTKGDVGPLATSACPSHMVTPVAQVSEQTVLFLHKKKNMHCKNILKHSNLLTSLSDVCTISPKQPSPHGCRPSLMGASTTLQRTQRTARTFIKQVHTCAFSVKQKSTARLAALTRKIVKVRSSVHDERTFKLVLPPAVEDSARSSPASVLL